MSEPSSQPQQNNNNLKQFGDRILSLDDDLHQQKHARHEAVKDKPFFRFLQKFEQRCAELRYEHPTMFNVGASQFLLSSFVLAGWIRKRTRLLFVSTTITLGATFATYCAYLRVLNREYRTYYALPLYAQQPALAVQTKSVTSNEQEDKERL